MLARGLPPLPAPPATLGQRLQPGIQLPLCCPTPSYGAQTHLHLVCPTIIPPLKTYPPYELGPLLPAT